MADALFEEPRLARIYDAVDGDRTPLDTYVSLIESLGARSALDIGCGTGTLACRLAARGLDVTAVDPAAASLDIARRKPHADRVRWLKGDATTLPPLAVDVATMTANVAQVFLTDEDWASALGGCHGRCGRAAGSCSRFGTRLERHGGAGTEPSRPAPRHRRRRRRFGSGARPRW